MGKEKNEFSELSDHELVSAFGSTGDPWTHEIIKAEERRRTAEQALSQAKISNKIAIASFLIAFLSLIVAIITLLKTS